MFSLSEVCLYLLDLVLDYIIICHYRNILFLQVSTEIYTRVFQNLLQHAQQTMNYTNSNEKNSSSNKKNKKIKQEENSDILCMQLCNLFRIHHRKNLACESMCAPPPGFTQQHPALLI